MATSRWGALPPGPEQAIDFELVDVEDARRALDQGHDIATQAGALMPDLPSAAPRARAPDASANVGPQGPREPLPAETVRWIVSLPADCRPLHLFMHYPKIGNHLALLWPQAEDAQAFFDELLVDNRGGRQGFPKGVFDDLMRLQHLLNQRRSGGQR